MTLGPQPPRCLILLASHNGAQFIEQQVLSILAQRDVGVEVLIGDDASTDETVSIVEKLDSSGRVRISRRAVGNGSAAQNFAQMIRDADAPNCDYVALSDQDDIWMDDKLRAAVDTLRSSRAAGYSCGVVARWPNGREEILLQSTRIRKADFLFEGAGQGCTFVLTRELFEYVQQVFRRRSDLTSQLVYHDWAIYAVARALGAKWTFDLAPHMWYRQHGGNDTGARHSIVGVRRRLALISSGRYRTQIALIADLAIDVSPESRIVLEWKALQDTRPLFVRGFRKAVFCFQHGRRRLADRILTSLVAFCGWI